MSHHKNKLRKEKAEPRAPHLKKLPVKKATPRKKTADAEIRIDLRQEQKDYASLIELLRRKLTKAVKATAPQDLKPMLATLVDEPFNGEDWQFELKLDGYRALAYLKNGKAEIRSRNNNNFN